MKESNIKLISESGRVAYANILGANQETLFYFIDHYYLFDDQVVEKVKSAQLI